MAGVTAYENKCKTLRQDEDSSVWASTMTRVGNEWKKLSKELPELNKDGIFIEAEEDLSSFHVLIMKHDDGPYKYIPFYFTISPCRNPEANLMYPMIPPIVKYNSFCREWIHPNIKPSGNICISILEYSYVGGKSDVWNPMMNIRSIILTLAGLLNKFAIKNEPMYARLKDTDPTTIHYDEAVQYACMKSTVSIFENLFDMERASTVTNSLHDRFKLQVKEKLKESLEFFKENCKDTNVTYKTYGFTLDTNYIDLKYRINKLLKYV
jgi:ubiquitin-protein ligase